MKKSDKKVKSKQKPKAKTVIKQKQKQKQNQSVVINISQNKAKTRPSAPRTVKPSYFQSITTYPIFREESSQLPLYRQQPDIKEESVFVDKTSLRTEIPESISLDNKTPEKSSYHKVYDKLYGESGIYDDIPDIAKTRLPPIKKRTGRPKAAPLTESEISDKASSYGNEEYLRKECTCILFFEKRKKSLYYGNEEYHRKSESKSCLLLDLRFVKVFGVYFRQFKQCIQITTPPYHIHTKTTSHPKAAHYNFSRHD